MIELYLHMKIYLDYFPESVNHDQLGKSLHLTF